MAPKKGKKKGKIGDDWDEDPEADVQLNTDPSVEPPAAVGKKAPKKKAKGKKGKPKFGDWDSDDDAAIPPTDLGNDEPDSVSGKEEKKHVSRGAGGSSGFAMLEVWRIAEILCLSAHFTDRKEASMTKPRMQFHDMVASRAYIKHPPYLCMVHRMTCKKILMMNRMSPQGKELQHLGSSWVMWHQVTKQMTLMMMRSRLHRRYCFPTLAGWFGPI